MGNYQNTRHHKGPRELVTGGEWIYGRNPVEQALAAGRRTAAFRTSPVGTKPLPARPLSAQRRGQALRGLAFGGEGEPPPHAPLLGGGQPSRAFLYYGPLDGLVFREP